VTPRSRLRVEISDIVRAEPESAVYTVHRVHSWRLEASASPPGLTLTLQTPEGRVAAFSVTPGQVAGMATLATYGAFPAMTGKTIN
jgi:hypothetical protein